MGIYLGIGPPTYKAGNVFAPALLNASRSKQLDRLEYYEATGSVLTSCFNLIWCWALNGRKRGMTHFLMVHSDVRPSGKDWLDIMLTEMKTAKADVLSVTIPIKDDRGLTSIALDTHQWRPQRVTQHQAMNELPQTWTSDNILLNTGLMLVDLRKPWVEQIHFRVEDMIYRDDTTGEWVSENMSEDWLFSRDARALGARLFATSAVRVQHTGETDFDSWQVWGRKADVPQGPATKPFPVTSAKGQTTIFDPNRNDG